MIVESSLEIALSEIWRSLGSRVSEKTTPLEMYNWCTCKPADALISRHSNQIFTQRISHEMTEVSR
jgi:hypothetical protein